MSDWFLSADRAAIPLNLPTFLLGLLLSFLSGQVLAWVYMWTHSGLSYSRSFVTSLVVIPIVVSLVMNVLNNNLVTAFGLMAVFAVVRFRNILRDTLDTSYVLSVIVLGMACGTQKYATAVMGCAVLAAVMLLLWYSSFGSRLRYDLIINLHWGRPLSELPVLLELLNRHSRRTYSASQRSSEGYEGTDLSYRLLLRDAGRVEDLLSELRSLEGVSRVTSLKADDESEV